MGVLKIATRNAKNSIAIDSISGTSVENNNKE